jgi:hypothetical protein
MVLYLGWKKTLLSGNVTLYTRVENALSLGEVVLVPEMNFLIDIVLHLNREERI